MDICRQVISKAKENNWSWPTHAWMFHTHSPEDLSIHTSISGMFFFQNSLIENEHHERRQLACNGTTCYRTNNSYAYFFYKTIMLSALMKNMTLVDTSLDYRVALNKISSLEGLSFNESTHTLFSSSVYISQATSENLVSVGYYTIPNRDI